jgi:type I restriction enzyme S subunit
MSKWESLPLGKLCEVTAGGTPSRTNPVYFGGGIPWVKIGDMLQGRITSTEETISRKGLENSAAKLLPPGTVLVSIFATIGRTAVLNIEAATNQAIAGVTPRNPNLLESSYLRYFLDNIANSLERSARGVAQLNINSTILKALPIPLPPLEEQKRIAEILDRSQFLISKRQEAIALLDTLTQGIFIEMFGDPVSNPKGWNVKTCKNICSRITVGIVVQPASYYQEYGVPALRSQNIKPDNLVFFSESDNETKLAKTRVKAGDVVLVRTGQPGTAAVIPKELDGVNAIDLLITTPCKDVVDSLYLCSFLNSSWGKKLVLSSQVGQVQKHLNVGILNNAQIICPPLLLQKEFAQRVEAVEKLKATHRASLSELQALFASLQHRAFRGEL